MNIEQLKYVQVVATHLSFSKAAEILYVSQSAISQAISKIEGDLNIKIFHRDTKQVELTREGQLAIELINGILQQADDLLNLKNNIKKADHLNLAIVKGLFLPFMLNLLKDRIADTQIQFLEYDSISIIEGIQKGKLDIGIIPIYAENEHILKFLRVVPIIDISYYVFVSCDSPLAKRKSLTYSDIEKESIILYDGPFLKWLFSSISNKQGANNVLFSSTNQEFIREFTSKNQGITIDTIAETIVNPHIQTNKVVAIPLITNHKSSSYLGIVTDLNNTDQVIFNNISKVIIQYVNDEIMNQLPLKNTK